MTFAVLAGALSFSAGAGFAEESPIWKEDVRGWTIAVDTTIGNGCFMYSSYEGDTYLRIQLNPEIDALQFIIGDLDWRSIEPGKLYPMEVQFGSRSPWTGEGLGFWFGEGTPSLVLDVPFEGERANTFIDELMQMTSVIVGYEGRQIANLSLTGTYAAMNEVIACQVEMEASAPTSGGDPFSSSAPAASDDPFAN
jgi:hypothetical protein